LCPREVIGGGSTRIFFIGEEFAVGGECLLPVTVLLELLGFFACCRLGRSGREAGGRKPQDGDN